MRRITQFTDETAALGFITVLEEDGIEGEMMSSGDQYQVWVIDDDHVGRAKELLQKFNNEQNPYEWKQPLQSRSVINLI